MQSGNLAYSSPRLHPSPGQANIADAATRQSDNARLEVTDARMESLP